MAEGLKDLIFKVNLPATRDDFLSGNGEGCFVSIDEETYKAWEDDKNIGGVYEGALLNDSIYYPNLQYGDKIKFELRGDKRPVALIEKYCEE